MSKLFFILLFFFFSVQKAINAIKCHDDIPFNLLPDLTISEIVNRHENEKHKLGKWLHFLFNHFGSVDDFKSYIGKIDLNSLDIHERDCFKRAVTIFLLHAECNRIRQLGSSGTNFVSFFKNTYKKGEPIVEEFIRAISIPNILNLLNSIVISADERKELDYNFFYFKVLIKKKKKDNYVLDKAAAEKVLFGNIDWFIGHLLKYGKNIKSKHVSYALRDYNLLAYFGLHTNYSNSDITEYSIPNINEKEKRRRGLFKRSSTFNVNTRGIPGYLSLIYNPCYHNEIKKGDFGFTHDLITVYTSIIQHKMFLGHTKFIGYFETALKRRSYKIEGLKGFRFLRQLFSRKTFSNFLKMYYNLISREWNFIIDDWMNQFDQAFRCEMNQFPHLAGFNYYKLKGRF